MISDINIGVKTKSQKWEAAFKYAIQKLFKQDMDQPIAMSLLEYTGQVVNIGDLFTMVSNDIDNFVLK